MEYETVIGLEVHVQLSTKSKIFCASSTEFGADPNEHVDALTLGMPGSLPVLNKTVVDYAIMLGLAMNCEIRNFNRFARKHYFYPDLPKGYQISQFEEPICERGYINVSFSPDSQRPIGIKRIHMEEDAGKNIHDMRTEASLIDLNRAGVPLLEIVSEPDIRSPAEAACYLRAVRQICRYLRISDGNMEEGSLRCDANISLRPVGEMKFGTRTEIKNINSFRFVEKALEYETARQLSLLKAGKQIRQETLLFDSASGSTRPMRGKEESSDYRYFPDPDLPPVVVEERWIREIRSQMPKLPEQISKELVEIYGLTPYDAGVLTSERDNVDFYLAVYDVCQNAKAACNWVTSELFGALNQQGLDISTSPVNAANLGALIKLIDSEIISGKMAKSVFEEMFKTSASPQEIVEKQGLKQITSEDEILSIIRQVFDANPSQLKSLLEGNDRLHGFFVGQVMKSTGGSANPKKVNELISREAQRLAGK
ncbi:MAG: Asp-tRNA(Asn)/Glu-tRNA(Gln) amidotransferase subunit GatB [Deltaproteobacteria bacterium]|nr:Asp-tRNA(Asn)/Glu-tRNA(Gln) amidotransferase subunit GatB [Deltaproteobacteria bacterium]